MMESKVNRAEKLTLELSEIYHNLVMETDDLDLKRLFKQLEADMMDSGHKLALAKRVM